MQEIIREIINIDKKAREAMQEALERKAGSAQTIDLKRAEASDKALRSARARVEDIRRADIRDASEQWEEIKKGCDAIAARLDDTFAENREKWVSDIVARVISGEDDQQ